MDLWQRQQQQQQQLQTMLLAAHTSSNYNNYNKKSNNSNWQLQEQQQIVYDFYKAPSKTKTNEKQIKQKSYNKIICKYYINIYIYTTTTT